MILKRNDR